MILATEGHQETCENEGAYYPFSQVSFESHTCANVQNTVVAYWLKSSVGTVLISVKTLIAGFDPVYFYIHFYRVLYRSSVCSLERALVVEANALEVIRIYTYIDVTIAQIYVYHRNTLSID